MSDILNRIKTIGEKSSNHWRIHILVDIILFKRFVYRKQKITCTYAEYVYKFIDAI